MDFDILNTLGKGDLTPKQLKRLLKKALNQMKEDIDSVISEAVDSAQQTLRGFGRGMQEAYAGIFPMLDDAFTVDNLGKVKEMSALYGEELAGALYTVQQNLNGLKEAIVRAAAPIARMLVPFANMAIHALTVLANTVGKIMEAFFGGSKGAKDYAKSVSGAINASRTLERSLAGFDQINRIGRSSGTTSLGSNLLPDTQAVLPGWQKLVEKVMELVEPLKKIDFSPVAEGLRKLYAAAKPIVKALFEGLEWAWYNIFVPIAQWTAENVLPAFLEVLTTALQALNRTIEMLRPAFTWLWENCLEKLMYWYADKVVNGLQAMTEKLQKVSTWITENSTLLQWVLSFLGQGIILVDRLSSDTDFLTQAGVEAGKMLHAVWTTLTSMPQPMLGLINAVNLLAPAVAGLTGTWDQLRLTAVNAWQWVKDCWAGASSWFSSQVFNPMASTSKEYINKIIGNFDGMVGAVAEAFNTVARAVNKSKVTIPSWVPEVGGMRLNFQVPDIVRPKIPRLAAGAVLPANKPFLAVVGDQTHGTNVEAPLTTIQEALSLAMEDKMQGMLAGFQAVTQRQERILQAILELDISDASIAGAVDRYQRKMAMAAGGL